MGINCKLSLIFRISLWLTKSSLLFKSLAIVNVITFATGKDLNNKLDFVTPREICKCSNSTLREALTNIDVKGKLYQVTTLTKPTITMHNQNK